MGVPIGPGNYGYDPNIVQTGVDRNGLPTYGNVPAAQRYGGGGGAIQLAPQMIKPYRTVAEATQAYHESLTSGANLPLSLFLSNVQAPNAFSNNNFLPPGSSTAGSSSTTGSMTGLTARALPSEARAQAEALVARLAGQKDFGYTPEEFAQMGVSPEEERGIIGQAQRPIAGAADKARQALEIRAAAAGGYAPGLNATIERTQQEEGRQAGEAVTGARMAVEDARRAAAIAAANARIGQQNTVTGQLSGFLSSYPESTTNTQGTNTQQAQETQATGPANVGALVPGGLNTPSPATIVGGGGAGLRPKAAPKAPNALAPSGGKFFGFGGY